MKRLPIRLRSFRNWLAGKTPNVIVGRGYRPDDCPLANFLAGRLDAQSVQVTDDRAFVVRWGHEDEEVYELPRWAREFVYVVDVAHPRAGVIRAREALVLLDCVP